MTAKKKSVNATSFNADTLKPAVLTRPHRAVVLTMEQRDEINDIRNLVLALWNAILGADIGEHDTSALCALARTIEDRLTALNDEFDAFAEQGAAS